MSRSTYQASPKPFSVFDGLLLKNTVLEKGLVVAPVVAVSNTLKNAVALSIAFGLITFFTVLLSSFISKKMPYSLRVIIGVLIAGVVYIPTAMLIDLIFPGVSYQLGIFLPLMATNSLIVWRNESRFQKEERKAMTLDLLFHILGFTVVIFIMGYIRELWGMGTIWESPVDWASPVTGIVLPFSGFILLGFLASILHRYRNHVLSVPDDGEVPDFGYNSMKLAAKGGSKPEEEAFYE